MMALPTARSLCRVTWLPPIEWCLKGAKGAQDDEDDGTVMILDTGCTRQCAAAMRITR